MLFLGRWSTVIVGSGGLRRQVSRWLWAALLLVIFGACSREPADLTARVEELIRGGDFQAALAIVESRLEQAPHDSNARLLKVKLLIHARAVDEALQEYQEIWRIQGNPHTDLLDRILNAYLVEEVEAGGSSRLRAAPLVARLADPVVVPLLYELASKGDRAGRSVAIKALSRLGSESVISFLASLLEDPDPYIRAQAARGLGRLGAHITKPKLTQLLHDDWEVARYAAAEGLIRLGERRATPILLQALRSSQASIRMQAAEVLGALAVQEAAPTLLATLSDSDHYVRLYAAQALVQLGETEGLIVLRRTLQHPSLSLRLYAAEALANLRDRTPRSWLHRVVADRTMAKGVRLNAAWILGRLDDSSGIRHIGGLLQDADPYVRLRTAWTLGEIGDPEASLVLRSALGDRERTVRIHATWALNRLLRQRSRVRG